MLRSPALLSVWCVWALCLTAGWLRPASGWIANGPSGYIVSTDLLINGTVSVVQASSSGAAVDLLVSIQQLQAQLSSQQQYVLDVINNVEQQIGTLQTQVGTLQAQLTQAQLTLAPGFTAYFSPGSGTYTVPTSSSGTYPLYLRVRMTGAGGGGSAVWESDNYMGGGAGGETTFGALVAYGGYGGGASEFGCPGGAGGGAGLLYGFDGSYLAYSGNTGEGGQWENVGSGGVYVELSGGQGATSMFGFSASTSNYQGGAGAQFGGGGAGACASVRPNDGDVSTGGGGGSGGYIEAYVYNPSGAYSWAVGSGGASGTGPDYPVDCNGLGGAAGAIIVEAFWH